MQIQLHLIRCCWVSQKHLSVLRAGYLLHRSRKQRKYCHLQAIQGKTDDMLGLKENVITGHPIPAGTGLREFDNMIVGSKEEYELLQTTREAMSFDEEE
jgi:hypothetical protein